MACEWSDKIFTVTSGDFEGLALEIFAFQYAENPVYRSFVDTLGVQVDKVDKVYKVPFLPVSLFKTNKVMTGLFEPQLIFESSGTTQSSNSHHYVKDAEVYKRSFLTAFDQFYGSPKDWCILGQLPSYLERGNSSLVYMVDKLIKESGHSKSGFYLDDLNELMDTVDELEEKKQKTLLLGVGFALLDLADQHPRELKYTTIMETGGMKGRRVEMTREELHGMLREAFGVPVIHSEYGMTELLSQAYSKEDGLFHAPAWMKILVRDEEDPLDLKDSGRGVINVIDLANVYSCSFIATDDAGRLNSDGSFEVMGRVDWSDVRGCSLLVV